MNKKMFYDEEDLLPISALQHLMFCERQWALIHLEQIWEENVLTAEGRELHKRIDIPGVSVKAATKTTRSLRLRSLELGLTGIADVVEFRSGKEMKIPYPIEYKRGRPKKDLVDIVQLCAQAFCLEEMLQVRVPQGALFYKETKRQLKIDFNDELREKTLILIKRLHQVTHAKKTPLARYEKKCENCSLIHWCMPMCTGGLNSASDYISTIIKCVLEDIEDL